MEGDVLHWWHEELLFGARTKFSDDYLWLIYVTYEYLKVTNDYSILDEKVPFAEGEHLAGYEVEKGINFSYTANQESLYYHLKIAIEKAIRQMGSHGLPLMGNGDWNDGMNKVGDKGHGESVWVGFFLYDLLLKMPDIIHDDDTELIKLCSATAQSLKEAINIHAWDGKWYLRAFFDDGTPLGSHANLDCQIDLISQSWSILTGIADQKRIDSVIKEVEKRLVDRKNNIIKLLDSPFLKHGHNPGYISDYLPGVRENGAQYTHAALWYIMALIKSGNIDLANQYYTMINPINRNSDVYQTEPYVIAADIYSNKNYPGKGGWTWYTGSASWAYKIAIEEILGIKKRGNKLEINPNMNSDWKNVEFEYQYEDTIYKIIINNTKKMHVIELVNDHQEHSIVIKEEGNNDHI